MANEIMVYGSNWCGATKRILHHLESLGVAYQYVNVDQNPDDEKRIAAWNNGRAVRPTLDIDGDVFVNPDATTLNGELQKRGLLPEGEEIYE